MLKQLFNKFRGGQSVEVPGYVTGSLLREGSMSKLFRATDEETGGVVVIKVLKPTARRIVEKLETHFRDFTEGDITASVDHPNVVKCFDHGQTGGLPYLVMELLEGMTLGNLTSGDSRRLNGQRLAILRQAAGALAHIHEKRFVHHDFCGKNLFMTSEDVVKVIDFGLAMPLLDHPTIVSRMGTPEILAPEVLKHEPSDYRVDIFAFGIVAYEVLSGHWPFESPESHQTPMLKVMNIHPVPLDKRPANIPPDVATMVMRCLEKDPNKRLNSMNTAVGVLERHQEQF